MKTFKARVTGKWIKGIILKRAYIGVKFTDNLLEPEYFDIPVKMALWHDVKIGSLIEIPMEQGEDKLWYPQK